MRSTTILCCLIIFVSCSPETKTYRVNRIDNDGPEKWQHTEKLTGFSYPWEDEIPEPTTFSAVHDDSTLYCRFVVKDSTLVVSDTIRGELDITREDRVEVYFSEDREMKEYYCLEIDPQGRILDYRASYYRQFDSSWSMEGIRSRGERTPEGYRVELSIPVKWLPCRKQGQLVSFFAGLYRADLRIDCNKKLSEHWISWIDPKTEQPDFHVPKSLGKFMLIK